jgi:fibronectin type 3 domain-containing protein
LLRLWLLPSILLFLCGCGYVGEPLPPLLNIPQPVADLAAVQRGSKIIIQFTLPVFTTEGRNIRPPLVWDLRIGEPGKGEFHVEDWAARAASPIKPQVDNGHVNYEIAVTPWVGKDVILGVRVQSGNRRFSDWSKLVTLSVLKPPAIPRDLKTENLPDGVRLTWTGAGSSYRIYRSTEAEGGFTVAATTETPEYLDRAIEYGKPVHYIVQAMVKTGAGEVESDLSQEVSRTPVDVFPPAPPAGLAAVPTVSSIELAWDRNNEPDLAGYRIYRAVAGGDFEKIGEIALTPIYTDKTVESGKHYRYAVTAFDHAGNESKRSQEVEVSTP